MENCIFCRIATGEIAAQKVYEDEKVIAFNDIQPQAPIHILIIPKFHYDSILDAGSETVQAMASSATRIATEQGLDKNGFRLVINTGKDGGQSVKHLHMHLLGGRSMEWPPG